MKDLQGVENAKLIQIGEEICDMISEYIERPWYEFTPEEARFIDGDIVIFKIND